MPNNFQNSFGSPEKLLHQQSCFRSFTNKVVSEAILEEAETMPNKPLHKWKRLWPSWTGQEELASRLASSPLSLSGSPGPRTRAARHASCTRASDRGRFFLPLGPRKRRAAARRPPGRKTNKQNNILLPGRRPVVAAGLG